MVRHDQRDAIVFLGFIGRILQTVEANLGNRVPRLESDHQFCERVMSIAPEGRDVHTPAGKSRQVADDQDAIVAVANLGNRQPSRPRIPQLHSKARVTENTVVVGIKNAEVFILVNQGWRFVMILSQKKPKPLFQRFYPAQAMSFHPGDHFSRVNGITLGKTDSDKRFPADTLKFIEGDFHGWFSSGSTGKLQSSSSASRALSVP